MYKFIIYKMHNTDINLYVRIYLILLYYMFDFDYNINPMPFVYEGSDSVRLAGLQYMPDT